MSRTVTHRAEWTMSQTLSWVIPGALTILLAVLYFTGGFSLVGAIVLGAMCLFMALFFFVANNRLKKNSALTAVMDDDESFSIQVFQASPRPYWNGRLDAKKEKTPLSAVDHISFKNMEGIEYIQADWSQDGYSKALTIPLRILIQDEVRKYVGAGLNTGKRVKFVNDQEKARFMHLIAEGDDLPQ